MKDYHDQQATGSQWERADIDTLRVEPLDESSPLFGDIPAFGPGISDDAVKDTAKNLGLAIKLNGRYYPARDTAFKSLLDRAKIGGSSLPKLQRHILAETLNECLSLQKNTRALLLIRDQKVTAVHSGGEKYETSRSYFREEPYGSPRFSPPSLRGEGHPLSTPHAHGGQIHIVLRRKAAMVIRIIRSFRSSN
jgi:hypothetical protein